MTAVALFWGFMRRSFSVSPNHFMRSIYLVESRFLMTITRPIMVSHQNSLEFLYQRTNLLFASFWTYFFLFPPTEGLRYGRQSAWPTDAQHDF